MASIPIVKPGFFLCRKPLKKGGWLHTTFPIRDKVYYLGSGWQEISPELAAEQQKPIRPPVIDPPERLESQAAPIPKPKDRPKRKNA